MLSPFYSFYLTSSFLFNKNWIIIKICFVHIRNMSKIVPGTYTSAGFDDFSLSFGNGRNRYSTVNLEYSIRHLILFLAVLCEPPEQIPNGRVVLSHNASVYGSVAEYSCNPPFVLQGHFRQKCLTSGFWDQPAPICKCKY